MRRLRQLLSLERVDRQFRIRICLFGKKKFEACFCFLFCLFCQYLPSKGLFDVRIHLFGKFLFENVFFLSFMFCKYLPSKRFKRGIVNLVTIFEKKQM